MKKILIIGAGAMGSAFSIPCAENNNDVTIMGSVLEDDFISSIKSNKNLHPSLNVILPKNIKIEKFSAIADTDLDLIVVAVSSAGVDWVGDEISKFYKSNTPIILLTKGAKCSCTPIASVLVTVSTTSSTACDLGLNT